MKAVIQRVTSGQVTEVHSGKVVGKIDNGLFILLGVKKGDTDEAATSIAQKIQKLRIFEDTPGKMSLSVKDKKYKVLLVSQFTLLADTSGGNRPSFINAEEPKRAKVLYEKVAKELEKYVDVEKGSFGNYMKIDVSLNGPVTIVVEI